MKKRDLLLAGLVLLNVSAFAQEEPTEPTRYPDDAKQIFIQDFEGSKDWQTIRLNPDPKRPTTLYTWQADPVDKIEQVTYYKRTATDNPSGGTNIYNGEAQWEIAGVRDTLIDMYDGVMRTDAAWPDDSTLQWDSHAIMDHTDATQHGEGGNKEYGLDRYGENGGSQYFRYTSATSRGTANRGGGGGNWWAPSHDEMSTSQDHYVPEYRRNLFVRNLPIENNSSYRVTVFVKPTMQTKLQKGVKARIGLDLMRGYFHSEKSFMVDSYGVKGSDGNISYKSFADKTDYTDLEVDKWNKITLMSYYNNDSVGRASAYLLAYYWNNDWDWNVKVDADGKVAEEGDSAVLKFVQQPDKYFVRLSFRSDSTQFDVDNLSLTKSWIAGVEYSGDMLRVDFGYKTNLGELAQAAKDMNKIAAVQLPGNYFDVWALWRDPDDETQTFWEQVPILSAEYQGDGYMYMWTEPTEEGDVRSFEGADSVLVSFFNSVATDDLKLKYTGEQYPNGMDTVWVQSGKPVFDFHNEIASLNPTIGISPVTKQPVKSLAELCPVLQKEPYEDGTFGLDPKTRTFTFKFSKNLSFDNSGKLSAKTKVILRGNGKEEYWNIKDYPAEDISGWTTIERPAQYSDDLAGDYVLSFEQVTHLKNPDLNNSEDYGDPVKLNYHFGDFEVAPVSRLVLNSDWRNDIVDKEASNKRPIPTSVYLHDGKDAFQKGQGTEVGNKCGFYNGPRDSVTVLGTKIPDDGMFYLSNRTSGVTGNLYSIVTLAKGNYNISFKFGGHSTTDIAMQLKFYAKPSGELEDGNDKGFVVLEAVANKTVLEAGKKPAVNQGGSYSTDTHWKDGIETVSYGFTVPADGDYVFEWVAEGASDYPGYCISNYWITTGGDLSMAPVSKLNEAIASAAAKLTAAAAAKYQGADFNALTRVKSVADGFIEIQKASMVNLPSEYAAETKIVDDAVKVLQLHMDTVDAFDKSFADVEKKLAVYADSLKAFEELAVVTALKDVKTTMSDYAYSEKAPGVIAADTKTMNDAIKAVDDRQAINDQFTTAIADAQKSLADPKASKFVAEYANLDEAIADAQAFAAVSATDDELKAQMASLNEIKLALDIKLLAADVVSIRIKALDKLAKSVGANYGDATAEIQGRIDNIDSDDDGLANVMKAAIKAALYSKIANNDSIGVVDLTPFIKNYHLYATITSPVVDNSSKTLPGARNDAELKAVNNPGSQIMKVGHEWGADALDKKIWVLMYGEAFDNIFPGWTIESFITGNHSMVTPDNADYTNLSKGVPVFDGAVTLDWNSKAELKTVVEDLPAGIYSIGASLANGRADNSNTTASLTVASSDTTLTQTEKPTTVTTVKYSLDSLAVADGSLSIDFDIETKSGGANVDNFTLKFLAKDANFNYALAAESAIREMNALITVVGDVEAAGAKIEYFTLGGIQVNVLEKGQAYIQKITIGDEIITKTVFVE